MMEEGARIPRLPMVERLAQALRVSPAWLAFGTNEEWMPVEEPRCAALPERVREVRTMKGLTLREVGRRANSSAAAIRSIESGTMPTLDTLEVLAKALGVSAAWLAYGAGPRVRARRKALKPEERTESMP